MVAASTGITLQSLGSELFEVVTRLFLAASRGRRAANDLKETEYLTLALLADHGTMIVGDIQRVLRVMPAQMSRIIRSLEARAEPFIECRINPRDKRKIDVCLTAEGGKALADYRLARVRRIVDLLRDFPEEDRECLNRLLHRLHDRLGHATELNA